MKEDSLSNVYIARVQLLKGTGDWAALVRYWMVHLYGPAMDDALLLVNDRAARVGAHWPILRDYLERVRAKPFDLDRNAPNLKNAVMTEAERVTVALTWSYPRVLACELTDYVWVDTQAPLLESAREMTLSRNAECFIQFS